MVFTAYNCEQIYMKRIMVAGGGMGNGNAYAVIEILYNDEQMEEVDSVWYKEFGNNPISKRIGNDVEWCEDDTFKILEDGEYVEDEDKEEQEEEEEEDNNYVFITQEQYDRWIKNMNKNKTGTGWIYNNGKRYKLFKDDKNNLYFIDKYEIYCKIKNKDKD